MKLSPIQEKFVLHWGEMGTRWGINRSVAQIHALLYIAPKPLPAEEIAETLAVARSNVSNSLRELQGWQIVKMVHVLDDKRDHFESVRDVWELFRIVLDERKRREVDPTLAMLEECLAEAGKERHPDPGTVERLRALHRCFHTATTWYAQVSRLPTSALVKLFSAGDKLLKGLGPVA